MIKHFYTALIVPLSTLIPIFMGMQSKKHCTKQSLIILFYLIFCFIINISSSIIGSYHINNLPLLHLYTLVEFLLILSYFKATLRNAYSLNLIKLLMVLLPVVNIGTLLYTHDIFNFNTYPRTISALIIISLSMLHLFEINDSDRENSWATGSLNWYSTGLLIYFCSSLVYFAFLNTLTLHTNQSIYNLFSGLHATLVLVMYSMFSVGFIKLKHAG